MTARLAILADIHANVWALEAVLGHASNRGVDVSTLTGKTMCGYQGWFNCEGDGMQLGFRHWAKGRTLGPGTAKIDLWPDLTECAPAERYATGLVHQDGRAAEVFSSAQRDTVVRHFQWMRDYGIDGVALQRFLKDVYIDSTWAALKNTNLVNVRLGAETYGRVFFIMYDISNDDPSLVISHLQSDWAYVTGTLQITNSSRYLKHRGKPLVALWGLGFNGGLASPPSDGQTMINFFKSAGCTVMGVQLPFKKTIIAVTFIAGLLPVLGNLISNTVIVVVSLSHSFYIATVSLIFLIAVHKLEYFLNARIVGAEIKAAAWELLAAMLVMEAAFGLPGLIAAPIFYAYLKTELRSLGWI